MTGYRTNPSNRKQRLRWAEQLKRISEGLTYDAVREECDEERLRDCYRCKHAISMAMEALWEISNANDLVDYKKVASEAIVKIREALADTLDDPGKRS